MLAGKTTLIPLDLTHLVIADQGVQRMIHGAQREDSVSIGTTLAANIRPMFHDLLLFFANTYKDVFGLVEGPPLHDPVAVAALLPDSTLSFDDRDGERWHVEVVINGVHSKDKKTVGQLGRTVVTKADGKGVRIPRGLDVDKFWGLIDQALVNVEQILMMET